MIPSTAPVDSPHTDASARAPLWRPLAGLAALSLLTAALMAPLVEVAYRDEAAALLATVQTGLWVVGAAAPLLALAKGAVLAAVAWSVLVLGGAEVRFRGILGTTLVAELILAVQGPWMALLLWARGTGALAGPADLRLATGLDLLFPDPATLAGGVALSVTPFHAAWVIFLAWGFSRLVGGRRGLGAAAAMACWLPAPALAVLRGVAG